MPHINRVRVNNVRYNFGTQFYDDFIMRFDCKNVLYDLANGGGKSVLLLLLLQNLIPNCTLDDKQPVEKLFRGSGGSTVIHSLIEWKLDDYLIKDDYRYMLTGFCARKAKDDDGQNADRDAAAIEYFNYVIFYRHYNDNDLVNLPLSDGRERITYPGLKTYLKNLGKKDYELQVHIFERKGEYQRFISQYGLYESEWEIIRGINKTEGHVRTYFETRYRTTRKVVEDLLIEEIIQKAFAMRTSDGSENEAGNTAMMADTLYQIKDQLAELTRKKAEIRQYDEQQETLRGFGERIKTLDVLYEDEARLQYEIAKTYQTVLLNAKIKARDLSVAEKEKEQAADQQEEYSRKLETARIQSSREQLAFLEKLTEQYKKDMEELQNHQAVTRDNLNLRESMNDYLDYLEELKQYQSIEHTINHAASGQQELLTMLRDYTAEWGQRYTVRQQDLQELIEKCRTDIAVNDEKKKELDSNERDADRLQAVLEHQIEEGRTSEKAYLREFGRLREETGLLVVEEIGRVIREKSKEVKEAEEKLAKNQIGQDNAIARLQEITLRLGQLTPEISRVGEEIQRLSAFMEEWKEQQDRMQKLLGIYKAESTGDLRNQLLQRYQHMVCEMESKRQQIVWLQKNLEELAAGSTMPVPEDVQLFMEYIRTCHGLTCVYGSEYLKDFTVEEKAVLLDRIPMLPYTVILREGFSKLMEDTLLNEKVFGSHAIPVMGLDTILSEEKITDNGQLLFVGRGNAYFLDEKLQEREQARCQNELTELNKHLIRMEDQQHTYEKDLEDVTGFLLMYESQKNGYLTALEDNQSAKQQLLKEQADLKEEQQNLSESLDSLRQDGSELGRVLEGLKHQAEILDQLKQVDYALVDVRNQLKEQGEKRIALIQEKQRRKNILDQLASEQSELNSQMETALGQQEALETEWNEAWKAYVADDLENDEKKSNDIADSVTGGLMAMSDDELRAAFLGIREAYEREHTDLADKLKLKESYSRSMERLLKSIADRNLQKEQLDGLYTNNQLYSTGESEIQDIREQLLSIADRIESLRIKLNEREADKNRLSGSVDQAVTVIEEKYGVYKEVNLNDQTYEVYVQNMTQLCTEAEEKYNRASRNLDRLTRDRYILEGMCRDLERLMSLCHVTVNLTKDTWDLNVNLRYKYDELLGKYERSQSERFAKRDAFEKDKARTIAELQRLGADGLAADIREHLSLPENAQAAKDIMVNIAETIQLIDIEKENVGRNMEAIMHIKESFEDQCLQICKNIRMELDKLPKMSVITMGSEQIQMIGLNIPYVKETLYKQQMSAYIDEIVKAADACPTQDEKIRYIRQQLAWKRLFTVIVTDMNAIKLMLYKRERIASQSRYLKYEEAVGSTGQSQGIYIQFLIAIIHYISCIHAGTASGEALKKVIFIDNPFGAAKDIYIWEPIFALLKTNDVQLVVPARGATPAITGKFDVNYVLGQKLMNNRQQTIVIDYHSNVNIEEMEYVKISYEQEVFDFI